MTPTTQLTGIVFMLSMAVVSSGLYAQSMTKNYTKVTYGYLMVLTQGASLFEELEHFAMAENIPSANISAMGFVNITFGHFDFKTKTYKPGEFNNVELASLLGTIAWKEGKPSIHAHGVVGTEAFESRAGHILKATVSTGSLEIMIIVHDKRLERRKDEKLGADVLDISGH